MADINVGQISEELNNKVDLPEGKSQSDVRQIIETYVNGTSGYRIWDDGYCEQWGVVKPSGVQVVSLLKTFIDTNYNVLAVNGNMDTSARRWSSAWAYTVSSIQVMTSASATESSTTQTMWRASGYLALGQY